MSNLGYCRFTNTLTDLEDCARHIWDDLDGMEFRNRKRLLLLCKDIVEQAFNEDGELDPELLNEPTDEED